MTDATILIPTYRHPAALPYSLRSALAQEGPAIEVFVVADGVEDDTRAALAPFLADPRVRVFDLPKGERNGERNRHVALAEAAGRVVCYLSDDDLLLPRHVVTMLDLLEEADFAHSAPFRVEPGNVLTYMPFDLAQERQQARLRHGGWNAIGLTGAAHTLSAYRRLPWGWRPAPPDVWTDLHMWQQFLDLPGFRGVTGLELTHLHLPSPLWSGRPPEEQLEALVEWSASIQDPAGRRQLAQRADRARVAQAAMSDLGWGEHHRRGLELEAQLGERAGQLAERDAAIAERDRQLAERGAELAHQARKLVERETAIADLRTALAAVESSRTWRLRNRLLTLRPLRALAARLPAAR